MKATTTTKELPLYVFSLFPTFESKNWKNTWGEQTWKWELRDRQTDRQRSKYSKILECRWSGDQRIDLGIPRGGGAKKSVPTCTLYYQHMETRKIHVANPSLICQISSDNQRKIHIICNPPCFAFQLIQKDETKLGSFLLLSTLPMLQQFWLFWTWISVHSKTLILPQATKPLSGELNSLWQLHIWLPRKWTKVVIIYIY